MSRLARLRRALARRRLAGAIAVGQAVGRGALALALLLLVRHLDPVEFADLSLALATLAIIATVADAGFARLLVRDAARAGDAGIWIVRELLRVRLRAVVVAAVGAAVVLGFGPGEHDIIFVGLAVAYLVTESIAFGYENAAVGVERPLRFVFAQVLAAVAMLGGVGALILTNSVGLAAAMAVFAASSALKVCGHLLAWRRGADRAAPSPRRAAGTLFRQALPFLGLTLLATVYYRVGVIALYAIRGPTETAPYAAASRVIDAIGLLAGVAFLSVSPGLSRMHRDHPEAIWPAWRRRVLLVASFAVPCVLVTALLAPPICGFLFGARYRVSAAADLRLMLPGAALMVVQALSAAVVFMSDDHRDVLRLTAINVTACVAVTIALSSVWGSRGAALALTAAEALSVGSFALLIRRRHWRPASVGA